MRYRFGEFELDATSFELIRAGAPVKVWPKVFDVLRYLIERRGQTVTKQEMLDTLWSDSHVDEVAVPWTISHARRALGQASADKTPIETVHGRGYRFTAVVDVVDEPKPQQPSSVVRALAGNEAQAELPFVGRDEAMQQLLGRLLEAKAGKGGLCLLVGPAGIGKTRCMDELSARATDQGFDVCVGRSVEDSWAPVYWPWVQIVRQAVRQRPSLAEQGNALLERLGRAERERDIEDGVGDGDDTAPSTDNNFWWIDGVSRLLLSAAAEKPLLLVLDDLHWADTATIDLLTFLAPDLRHVPFLVLASQRDVPSVLRARALQRLSRHVQRIELGPLTERDVADYVRRIAHLTTLGSELGVAIHRSTAGNPLFLEQTVRTLVARHGNTALASLSPDRIEPSDVARNVLGAALQVLDPSVRELLEVASVLGERFDVATLQQLSDCPVEELLALLEHARIAGFLIAEEPIAYRFCHALLRSILYGGSPAEKRTIRHRRTAQILERSPVSRSGEIAHHYYASLALGDYERVTTAAHHAARVAARMQAFADAALFCEWALTAQARESDPQPRARAELLVFSAQMQFNAGHEDDARQTIETLIEIARPRRYFDLLVRAARIVRHSHMMGALEDPLVRGLLEEALQHAPTGANELRINTLSQLSWVPPYALEIERSKALSGEALDLAHALGDDRLLLRALNARLYSLSGPDDIEAQLATVHEMLERNHANRGWASAAALGARYSAYLQRGDMRSADQTCAALGRIAKDGQWPAAIWYHERLSAQRKLLNGEFKATASTLVELRERGRRLRVSYAGNLVDILQAVLTIEQHGARAVLDNVAPVFLRDQLPTALITIRPSVARLLIALGDPAPAKAALDDLARDDFAAVPRDISYLNALCNLAIIATELSDRASAERLYELLAPYPHFNTPNVLQLYEGSVSHFLGVLAAFLNRADGVATHFDDALAMNEQLGQQPQLARTCQQYSRWLLTHNDRTRRNSGKALHTRARTIADALGMSGLLTQLDQPVAVLI